MNNKKEISFEISHLFGRSLKEMSPAYNPLHPRDSLESELDRLWADKYDVGYKYNTHGYRCQDFKNQELMFLGCSNTFGMGMNLENTFPYLLSQKLKMQYINLGAGGDSAQAQIIKAFTFFKEFYNPEYIIAVFPFFRLEFPKVEGILSTKKRTKELHINQHFFNQDSDMIQKISKAPYDLDKILPKEVAVFYNFMFVEMLIQYCNTNNIKLLWTTNDIHDLKIDKMLKEKYPNQYFSLDFFSKDKLKYYDCHSEFKDKINFNMAADDGHVGLHYHIHLAELLHRLMV